MEANHNTPCPIVGEPTPAQRRLTHYVLEAMTKREIIDALVHYMTNNATPADYEMLSYSVKCAITSQSNLWWFNEHVRERLWEEANNSNRYNPLTPVDELIEASDRIDEMPADYWHGEMKAEAEAERQADAALELAAELASCDWEGWN